MNVYIGDKIIKKNKELIIIKVKIEVIFSGEKENVFGKEFRRVCEVLVMFIF